MPTTTNTTVTASKTTPTNLCDAAFSGRPSYAVDLAAHNAPITFLSPALAAIVSVLGLHGRPATTITSSVAQVLAGWSRLAAWPRRPEGFRGVVFPAVEAAVYKSSGCGA